MGVIFAIEPQCDGYEHANFNAALIHNILNNNKNDKIHLFVTKTHFDALKKILPQNQLGRISFFSACFPRKSRIEKFLGIVKLLLKAENHGNQKHKSRVIFLSIDEITLTAIRFSQIFLSRTRIACVVHSILNTIVKKPRKTGFLKTIFYPFFSFKTFFLKFNSEKISFILLGNQIKENLIKLYPKMSEYIITIHHPYFFQNNDNNNRNTNEGPLKVGFLGIGSNEKGLMEFNNIAKHFRDSHKIKFYLLGKLKSTDALSKIYFSTPFKNEMCSYKDFTLKAKEMDYFIFVLKPDEYILRASGTFFDAINFEKPIIFLKNSFLDYYSKILGKIGFRLESLEKVQSKLEELTEKGCPDYSSMIRNLKQAKSFFKSESLEDVKKLNNFWYK